MRQAGVLILAVLAASLCAAGQMCAAAVSAGAPSGGSQTGDDLTVCCQAVFTPPAAAPTTPPLFVPQVVGCTAIGYDAKSINGCPGVVMGCDEGAFICTPSLNTPGTKDCACVQFNSISAAAK